MLNFIFIEVTWELGYLRWLNFVPEKWLRRHFMSSCKMITKHGDKLIPIKCELWVEMSARIIRTRFQDPLQFLWLTEHSWSPKITNFWTSKEVLYVRKLGPFFSKYRFLRLEFFFSLSTHPVNPISSVVVWI